MVLKFISATRFLVIIPIIGLALTASVLFVLAGFSAWLVRADARRQSPTSPSA